MTKKQLCDWADELRFADLFKTLDNVPNKPKIHLYNDLKDRYIAGENNRQFAGQVQAYISLLDIPEKPAAITPQEMGLASYQLADLLKQEGEISPEKAKEIFEAVNKMMEKMNHDINKKINPETKAEVFFERIISENKLNQTDTNDIRNLLKAEALPYAYQCILVSALMLSLVRKYDKTRTDLLIDALNENVPHVWERALLALVLGLSGIEEKVKADTAIVRRLQALQTQEAVQKALVSLSQALYQIQIEKVVENNKLTTILPNFRNLGFFAKENKPHYWFMPFYAENTELLDFFEESNSNLNHKYLIELLASPYELTLSDSNKYALCFATSTLTDWQNKRFIQIFENEIQEWKKNEQEFIRYGQYHYFLNLLTDSWYFSNFYSAKEWAKVLDKQQLLHDTPLLDLVGTKQSKNLVAETLFEQVIWLDNPLQKKQIYQAIVQLNPQKHEAWNNLGLLYQTHLQEYEQAKAAYLQAIAIKADFHEAWRNLGLLYQYHLNDNKQAKAAYLQAIAIKPDFHDAIGNLGWLYFIQGQLAEAEGYFEKSVSLGSEYSKMNLGHIRLWQGRQQEALALYAQSLESMKNKEMFFAGMEDDFHYIAPHGVSTAVFEEVIAKLKRG